MRASYINPSIRVNENETNLQSTQPPLKGQEESGDGDDKNDPRLCVI